MTAPKAQKAPKTPPPPTGLAASGAKLWRSVTQEFDLEIFEELLLLQAARCADALDRLALEASDSPVTTFNAKGDLTAHPALIEGRQQAIVLSRLLASLRLPSGEEVGERRPQRRGGARGSYGLQALGA
jgi:hypothetical protein